MRKAKSLWTAISGILILFAIYLSLASPLYAEEQELSTIELRPLMAPTPQEIERQEHQRLVRGLQEFLKIQEEDEIKTATREAAYIAADSIFEIRNLIPDIPFSFSIVNTTEGEMNLKWITAHSPFKTIYQASPYRELKPAGREFRELSILHGRMRALQQEIVKAPRVTPQAKATLSQIHGQQAELMGKIGEKSIAFRTDLDLTPYLLEVGDRTTVTVQAVITGGGQFLTVERNFTFTLNPSLPSPGGWSRGDFHIHTVFSDGSHTVAEMARSAKGRGMQAIIITDHDHDLPGENVTNGINVGNWPTYKAEIRAAATASGITVLPGVEFGRNEGHLLAYNLDRFSELTKRDGQHTINHVSRSTNLPIYPGPGGLGGFGYIAHPFIPWPVPIGWDDWKATGFKGLEVWNARWAPWDDRNAAEKWNELLGRGRKIFAIGNSDAHDSSSIGAVFNFIRRDNPRATEEEVTEEEIINALKTGKVVFGQGPFLNFTINKARMGNTIIEVDEAGVGGTVTLPQGATSVNLKVDWKDYNNSLDKIRIIRIDADTIRESRLLDPGSSFWVEVNPNNTRAIRLEGWDTHQVNEIVVFTNPIWIEFNAAPPAMETTPAAPPPAPAPGNGGCFIATAIFGTPMVEEVVVLKRFRDEHLLANELGQRFVSLYYRHSPALAGCISDKEGAKRLMRIILWPLVRIVEFIVGGEEDCRQGSIGQRENANYLRQDRKAPEQNLSPHPSP